MSLTSGQKYLSPPAAKRSFVHLTDFTRNGRWKEGDAIGVTLCKVCFGPGQAAEKRPPLRGTGDHGPPCYRPAGRGQLQRRGRAWPGGAAPNSPHSGGRERPGPLPLPPPPGPGSNGPRAARPEEAAPAGARPGGRAAERREEEEEAGRGRTGVASLTLGTALREREGPGGDGRWARVPVPHSRPGPAVTCGPAAPPRAAPPRQGGGGGG